MEEQPDTIIEERVDYMVSPTGDGKKSTFRTAHFLKPSVTSIDKPPIFEFPSHSLSSLPTTSEPSKWPLKVTFNGWRNPLRNWKTWVDHLESKYQSLWKEVGVYEAIMASKYETRRYEDLVLGVAEKWCIETNTFMFPWGEATVTLEDIMILGGYSVLGHSVSSPLETDELKSIEQKLIKVRQQISRTKAQKASQQLWIKHFMEHDSEFEHEAFLSLWLSRFVFPLVLDTIVKHVFPIAVHLARGKTIALAPAVLASIYRDLSLLKEKIVACSKLKFSEDKNESLSLTLWSPFQIVQIWAWERFVKLHPKPNLIEYNEPRVARWHKLNRLRLENVTLALDSAGECFEWRPYAKNVDNWLFPKFYREREDWIVVDSDLDIEFESFARCLRVCELVGIDCIEQYLPHRVAMQFGMDQDIPGHVARSNASPEIAWKTYKKKPISNTKLYIPARISESGVTTRYSKWWRQSVMHGDVGQQRSSISSKKVQQSFKKRKGDNYPAVPPGFPPKCNRAQTVYSSEDDELTVAEMSSSKRLQDKLKEKKGDNDALVLPEFCPQYVNIKEEGDSVEEDDLTIRDLFNFSVGKSGNGKCTSDAQFQSLSSPNADNGGVKNLESSMARGDKMISSEAATAGLERVGEKANESGSTCAANNSEVKSSGYDAFEIPGLELEARISRLEKIFAGLKKKSVATILE